MLEHVTGLLKVLGARHVRFCFRMPSIQGCRVGGPEGLSPLVIFFERFWGFQPPPPSCFNFLKNYLCFCSFTVVTLMFLQWFIVHKEKHVKVIISCWFYLILLGKYQLHPRSYRPLVVLLALHHSFYLSSQLYTGSYFKASGCALQRKDLATQPHIAVAQDAAVLYTYLARYSPEPVMTLGLSFSSLLYQSMLALSFQAYRRVSK